jgi:hypothetical protein
MTNPTIRPIPRVVSLALIKELGLNNGERLEPSLAQQIRLAAAIRTMILAGVEFTETDIVVLAFGDRQEANEIFNGTPGYGELAAVLEEIFANGN